MIDYPDDRAIEGRVDALDIPAPVLVRDLVRVVEVLNLRRSEFFHRDSVLAGSMALRCFGSPRFTVYDADFSTTRDVVEPPTKMQQLLAYSDDDLDIKPAPLEPHDDGKTAWVSSPITFDPAFTSLVPDADDRKFKADISTRGLVLPGVERELSLPYDLPIWSEDPVVFVMDPHEIVAEKILGWCAHGLVKHYADLAYIALVSQPRSEQRLIELDYRNLRDIADAKLEIMRKLQPGIYARFKNVDGLIGALSKPAQLDQSQWAKIMYVRPVRDRFTPAALEAAVRDILAAGLRRAARR